MLAKITEGAEGKAREIWGQMKASKSLLRDDSIQCHYRFNIPAAVIIDIVEKIRNKKED